MPLAHGVCLVSDLLQEAGQEGDPGGQSCRLVPLYGAPLPAQAPGVAPRQQRRAARRALRVRVVAVQHHASRRVSKHSTCHNVSLATVTCPTIYHM